MFERFAAWTKQKWLISSTLTHIQKIDISITFFQLTSYCCLAFKKFAQKTTRKGSKTYHAVSCLKCLIISHVVFGSHLLQSQCLNDLHSKKRGNVSLTVNKDNFVCLHQISRPSDNVKNAIFPVRMCKEVASQAWPEYAPPA